MARLVAQDRTLRDAHGPGGEGMGWGGGGGGAATRKHNKGATDDNAEERESTHVRLGVGGGRATTPHTVRTT